MLVSVACIGVAYLLGRDLFRSRLAGIVSAAALLCFEGFITYSHRRAAREDRAWCSSCSCASLAMVHRRWGATGFFIALATLTWQPVFFAAAAGAARRGPARPSAPGRLRALVRIAVGGLVPTAVTVGAYAAIGQAASCSSTTSSSSTPSTPSRPRSSTTPA